MNRKLSEKEWMNDFKEFMECEGTNVPHELSQKVLTRIHSQMNPSSWLVFFKILGIHSIVGTLSLGICSQFGMNPFNTEFSLMDYFMKYGHTVCMALCGFVFISLSILIALLVLSSDETRVFKKNSYIHIFSLSLLSLVGFAAFGADIVLSFGLLWLIGGILGGLTPILLAQLKYNALRPEQ